MWSSSVFHSLCFAFIIVVAGPGVDVAANVDAAAPPPAECVYVAAAAAAVAAAAASVNADNADGMEAFGADAVTAAAVVCPNAVLS